MEGERHKQQMQLLIKLLIIIVLIGLQYLLNLDETTLKPCE